MALRLEVNMVIDIGIEEMEPPIFNDLGDHISSEQLLKNYKIALGKHAIVAITDREGCIKYANDTFCNISKYSRDELLGQDHRIINSGHHPKEFFRDMWKTISTGHVWQGDIKNRAKDGTCYWVKTTIIPFKDEKGTVFEYVSIRTDITDRVKLSDELMHANERLNQITQELKSEKIALNNKNIALNELINHIDQEKDQIKVTMSNNLETVIFPLLETLRSSSSTIDHKYIDLIFHSLKEISQPFFKGNHTIATKLTPKEIQICNMIKNGLAVKEIAKMLHLSPRTIDKHRENIRKKLGIKSKKVNLASYLLNENPSFLEHSIQ